ncbi:MAG: pyruvate kinase [Pirellulales bacterium]|nr:pyruvate kinase [Pirellulales bacterium]
MSTASFPAKRPPSRTKIVATLGPASETEEKIEELIRAGVDVFRLNSAHGTIEVLQTRLDSVRRASRAAGTTVAVLVDLAGPKIRLGELPDGSLTCKAGEMLSFVRGPEHGTSLQKGQSPFPALTATYPPLIDELSPGDRVMLADGTVELRVEQKTANAAVCSVVQGGTFRSRQGINLPGVKLSVRALTENDHQYARWAAEQGADYLGLSFVRRPEDVAELRELIAAGAGEGPRIIAKIEKPEAVENLEPLVAAADGIMVARGDLGVEIDIAAVPLVQKRIIAACHRAGKPVIVATQMLESMHHSLLPTRAEATDVANAILDGADACMLSGESAVGEYPVQAVQMMHRIALATESLLRGRRSAAAGTAAMQFGDCPVFSAGKMGLSPSTTPPAADNSITQAVTAGAVQIAEQLGARVLIVATASGETARIISQYRSFVHTVGVSDAEATLRRMCLFWGIIPMRDAPADDPVQLLRHVIDRGEGYLLPGDRVVLVLGTGIASSRHNGVMVYEVPG